MSDKMLIDASHQEETRVVVVRGNRIEEFDFESEHKKQIKGNIYLARVTRVEPSLQAAFVEYGGNRHGFLAFSEIHPDYYQIPVADRQALIEAEAAAASQEEDHEDGEPRTRERSGDRDKRNRRRGRRGSRQGDESTKLEASDEEGAANVEGEEAATGADAAGENIGSENTDNDNPSGDDNGGSQSMAAAIDADVVSEAVSLDQDDETDEDDAKAPARKPSRARKSRSNDKDDDAQDELDEVESVGAEDAMEEVPTHQRFQRRHYNIQDVIKRRQILLVQVVKEERGNKGAALTTYLSLAGRYSVLMPNTARGGGISRKITNVQDRKRLKDIVKDLEVPKGMGVILRTAGANRTKPEVKRDYEYLMRLWENVRNLTLSSTAPTLVYEEGSLIKRSIRDLYNKDITEIQVAGENGYREAKDFMRMLMPSHAKVVQPYRDMTPIFARNGIEAQLDRMLQPQVTLKSGGYIIINQTEALVAIDVNSGRSTREHSIEDTALQTNLEAAEEIARQLRLRDLAGLIVIDFIDMEENRNNRAVEKRMKECLKDDRARIQVGRISHFGLLEMSRQRIRASVLESTTQVCSVCGGTGHVRSASSIALHVMRSIEEYLLRHSQNNIIVRTTVPTALYVLNHKRQNLADLEARFGLTISIEADDSVGAQHFAIDKGSVALGPIVPLQDTLPVGISDDYDDNDPIVEEIDDEADDVSAEAPKTIDGDDNRKRKRKRRRRGGRDRQENAGAEQRQPAVREDIAEGEGEAPGEDAAAAAAREEEYRKKRRRGRRGGRKNKRFDDESAAKAVPDAEPVFVTIPLPDFAKAKQAGVTDVIAEAPVAPQEAETQEAGPQEAGPQAAAPLVEAEAEVEAPKARKAPAKRKSRAKAAAEPADTVAADAVVADSVTEESVAPAAEEAPAKPKRAPRKSTKKAAAEASEAKATSAPAEVTETAAPAPETPEAETPTVETPAEPAEPAKPVVTSTSKAAEGAPAPKRGWWQKKGFF
ncbi:Rne/Rng family ribonuclease [Phyllobacterium sp. 0TCS1.6C]|uniref:ribonuclease E/G n=1 Tax=unclassified Phyllobacterium TaxID=2638441 RepID=UPI002264B07C|nr:MULTISPECIES: ribonuclease E/G [unclassified Phyllobacterium]MCX8282612.1 Rne/Rng family ribonuclease [Phyllobacterium sp. 0TCS1.6C]MCX8294692.1 Rne/Rng family ribonuclease [Phyllobacterium sp. 0TCS1.6A]